MDAMNAMAAADAARLAGGPAPRATLALGAVRLAMRALSAAAPPLAARVAERMWFTPPRGRPSPAARAVLDAGTPAALRVDGRDVATWRWGAGPEVVLMHGWGGYGGQLHAFVRPLVDAGFAVVAFDAPSHGASAPSALGARQASLLEFGRVLEALARGRPQPHAVVAHSGGCTAAAWAMRRAFAPGRAVFLAPMATPARYARLFGRTLGLPDAVTARWQARSARRIGFDWDELAIPWVAGQVRTPPVLVVHDRGDREVAWDDGAAVAASWPDATLHTTEGLGHRRLLRDEGVVAAVRDYVAAGRAPGRRAGAA